MKHIDRLFKGCYIVRWYLFGYTAWMVFVVASMQFEYGLDALALTALCALVFAIYKLGEAYDANR